MIPEGNAFSMAKLLDLEVLLMGNGRERTRAEYEALMTRSGFHLAKVIDLGDDLSIMEGLPN
jgi:hypothetical protein